MSDENVWMLVGYPADSDDLADALKDGYEPFSVTEDEGRTTVWLRRPKVEEPDAPPTWGT